MTSLSESHAPPADSPALDRMFLALADPARRGMIDRLCRGPASVSELARPLDMTLSAVMQHLAVLEDSGFARSEKTGRVRTCRIEPAGLRFAERWIAERRTSWEHRLDRLGDYLAKDPFAGPDPPVQTNSLPNPPAKGEE